MVYMVMRTFAHFLCEQILINLYQEAINKENIY